MEIQQNRYKTMEPIPAPEPYTLPHTIRITYGTFIFWSVIFLPIIAFILHHLVTTNILDDLAGWIVCLLFAAFSLLMYLGAITWEIRLTGDRISYREWFSSKEMEYSRITAVRYYLGDNKEATNLMLDLSGDSGATITIYLSMFDSPTNRWIIYDVLKTKATRAGIDKSVVEFYTLPEENSWRKNLRPQPYTLPLTLRMNQDSFVVWFIAGLLLVALLAYPNRSIAAWVVFPVGMAGLFAAYLAIVMPAILLTEDRISYREWFSSKEMEYSRITAVRYYYQDTLSIPHSNPVLTLSGDNGDTITIRLNTDIPPGHLWIIYDVLKKKAPQAGLRNSLGVFFANPEAAAER